MGWLGRCGSLQLTAEEVLPLEQVISPPWLSWEEQVRGLLPLAAFPVPLTMSGQTVERSCLLQERSRVSLIHSSQGR